MDYAKQTLDNCLSAIRRCAKAWDYVTAWLQRDTRVSLDTTYAEFIAVHQRATVTVGNYKRGDANEMVYPMVLRDSIYSNVF